MQAPQVPYNESNRLEALYKLDLIDSHPEKEYDNITTLAAQLCDMPIALISLIDKDTQWFKAKHGTDLCKTQRDLSFCGHAINQPHEIMEVPNARVDERFKNNPLLDHPEKPLVYYCGVPLKDKQGNALGTLCVLDHKENSLSEAQKNALVALAFQVEKLFELREQNIYLRSVQKHLEEQNEKLKHFAGVVSHDMKMPLSNMIITTDMLKSRYGKQLDKEAVKYLGYLKQSAFKLSDYISSLLTHYETDKLTSASREESFFINHLLEDIIDLFHIDGECEINFPEEDQQLLCNKIALEQVLLNLIGNSLKYNDKEKIIINFSCYTDADFYHFSIQDNGMGIAKDQQKEVFTLFKTASKKDRNGNSGNGIGLSTVQKLIHSLGGEIHLDSELGKGTRFDFSVKKSHTKKIA